MAASKVVAQFIKSATKKKRKRKPQPDAKKSYEAEGARKSPDTGGSVDVSRKQDQAIIDKRTKVTAPKDDMNFLKLQQTKGSRERAKAKATLQRAINNKNLSKSVRDKAAKSLKKMRDVDASAERTRRVKQSQTQRSKKPVTLAGVKKTETPKKVSFMDEETGEIFEISKSKYDGMTTNQRNAMLRNFKARSRVGEDLSDKGMAAQRKKLAAAKDSRRERKAGGKIMKDVPADNPGLAKLPTKVRNRMGYKQSGGKMAGSVGKGGTRGTPEQGQRAYESEKAQMKEFQDYMKYVEEQLSDNRGGK